MGRLDDRRRNPERTRSVGDRAALDLVGDPSATARADSRASVDADLRQQPPPRRAAGRRAQRAGRRDARALASRVDRARTARRDRGSAQGGHLRALVATSSLELGIDMGAIDLVVQVEAPPSVASGLQRIGRSGHQIDAVSEGVIFPKFRGDLVACAAVPGRCTRDAVEATRYPRNPLDIVAQQIVAMTSMDEWHVDDLFATIRRAAPFAELSRAAVRRRARHAVGPLSVRRVRGAPSARHLGPRCRHDVARGKAPSAWRSRTAAPFPIAASYGVFLRGAPTRGRPRR